MIFIFLIIGVIFGAIASAVAGSKGRSAVIWFFVSFLFGGIPLIILLFLSDLKEEALSRAVSSVKECPSCAEDVQIKAKICRYCQHEFPMLQNENILPIEQLAGAEKKKFLDENEIKYNGFKSVYTYNGTEYKSFELVYNAVLLSDQ